MPDGNTAALNEYEAKQAEADRTWAALEPQAREDVRLAKLSKPSMDDVMDGLCRLTAMEEAEFLRACGRSDDSGAGAILTTALGRAVDYYLDTKAGQEAIAERVYEEDLDT